MTSSHDDDDDLEYLEESEEPVPQSEGEDYNTDGVLYYASDSEGEPQEQEQSLHNEFAMVWRIEDSRRKRLRQFVMETRPDMRLFTPLDAFQQWYQDHMAVDLRDYRFRRLVFTASYDNGDESGSSGFIGNRNGYRDSFHQLVRWSLLGCRKVTLSLIARVKKMPTTTLAQRARQITLARVPDLRTKLGTGGHPAARIRRHWTCTRPECDRFGLTCWWGVKDLPKYHVPIRRTHIRVWPSGIFEGKLTPRSPRPALIQRMIRQQQARAAIVALAPEVQKAFHGMSFTLEQSITINGVTLHLSFHGPEYIQPWPGARIRWLEVA